MKLDHKLHRSFAITKAISRDRITETTAPAPCLALLVRWHCHNTFHVSLIEPYRISKRGLRTDPDMADVRASATDIVADAKVVEQINEVIGS